MVNGEATHAMTVVKHNIALIFYQTVPNSVHSTRLLMEGSMRNLLRNTVVLAVFALPLAFGYPVKAQNMPDQPAYQEDGLMGQGKMGRGHHGRGMQGKGMGMMCGCPMMKDGMMDMEAMDMPAGRRRDAPEMARLRAEMMEHRKIMMAHREQMQTDCERMHQMRQKMKELIGKARVSGKAPSKGNASPGNPAMD